MGGRLAVTKNNLKTLMKYTIYYSMSKYTATCKRLALFDSFSEDKYRRNKQEAFLHEQQMHMIITR